MDMELSRLHSHLFSSGFKIEPANKQNRNGFFSSQKSELDLFTKMADVKELENYINGEFVACSRHLESYNPATGEVHLKIPDSGKQEVDGAVEAAKNAFKKSAIPTTP